MEVEDDHTWAWRLLLPPWWEHFPLMPDRTTTLVYGALIQLNAVSDKIKSACIRESNIMWAFTLSGERRWVDWYCPKNEFRALKRDCCVVLPLKLHHDRTLAPSVWLWIIHQVIKTFSVTSPLKSSLTFDLHGLEPSTIKEPIGSKYIFFLFGWINKNVKRNRDFSKIWIFFFF